ncbi:MAG TPA: hypothetical protein VFG30_15145 [Polyangiales bacterium]|nr:hypothetical protein [Polyangiales bacterium]
MTTAMRLVFVSAALLAGLALGPVAPRASAQDIQVEGPLAGAPAVIGLRIYREMRFQIQLQGTMTLNDEFSRAILTGGQLMFHPTDWLGIGVWGGFAVVNIETALTDQVAERGQTNEVNVLSLPRPGGFPDQIGKIQWIAAPQVHFIPLRGKLGIFEKLFIDTDFYLLGGVGFIGLEERADVLGEDFDRCSNGDLAMQITCLTPSQGERETRMAIAPTFGAGLSLFMGDWVAMTLEWRALPFAWNTSGTDESGNAKGDFPDEQINSDDQLAHFNHMFSLGFAFYLPTEPGLSHMDEDE